MHAPTDNLTSCTIVSGAGAHGGSGYRENFLSLLGATTNVAPEIFQDVPAACDYLAGPVGATAAAAAAAGNTAGGAAAYGLGSVDRGAREQRGLRATLRPRGETSRLQLAAGVWSSHGFIISAANDPYTGGDSDCSGLSRHGIWETDGVFFFWRGELAGCRFFWWLQASCRIHVYQQQYT